MRKFFTLTMMVMMTISAIADEVVLFESDPIVCDKWEGVGLLSDSGTELKNACAQAGDKIKIYADVSSASEGWQLQVCEGHWDKDAEGNTVTYASFSQDNGDFADGTATFELTEAILTRALTKSWWGNSFILNGTGGIKVNKVSLIRAVSYPEEGKSVTFDDSNGFIAAEQFAGLNERSKVVFTYTVSADPGEKKGWGIGRIGSNDDKNDGNGPSVTLAEVPANAAGEHTLTLLVSDINKGLAATPDGIVWQMWTFDDGAVTATRVKIEIFEATVDGETATALWTAAGVETIFGSSWGAEDAANDMTSEDGINYTLTKENVTLEKGIGYEFKILKDHAWTEAYPAENYSFSVEETAVYTVAITFNADTKEITVTTTKTGEADIPETSLWTAAGSGTVFGSTWVQDDATNDMTSEDGINYTLTKENVTLEKGTNYEFKIVKDHAWTVAYPSQNYTFTVDETAIYTVTITFNADSKEITVTTTKTGESAAVDHTYSVIGTFNGDNWSVDNDMTETSEGIFNLILTNVAAGTYKFKVRTDHAWDAAYPSSDYEVKVTEDGSTVTISFNETDKTVEATVVENASGIDNVNAAKNLNSSRFNLAGQQVDKNYKGIVILNGKKYLQK